MLWSLVWVLVLAQVGHGFSETVGNKTAVNELRGSKALSVFNIVSFPNSACGANSGYNGTCYTTSECSSLGGTASGTCASSFGVCCVFTISCGATTSANNSYAIITSYSTSSDKDPCTYTFCKANSDVCKLRIDFDTMVLAGPFTTTTTTVSPDDGPRVGDCGVDTLTVTNPGGASPPIICGYNSGQHMFIPASDSCNSINIDVDTGTTTTTRKWQIKVSQFECGNMMAPEQDCLQYLTAATGTIASFNWDTSSTTAAKTQYHLSSQFYDVCIRRARSMCSVCYSPNIISAIDGTASSYGVGGSGDKDAQKSAVGSLCSGITTQPATLANGDYLEILNMQAPPAIDGTITTVSRICGAFFNAATTIAAEHKTACSFATPFKVGVHFDEEESVKDKPTAAAADLVKVENDPAATAGSGYGYSGFWLYYWQNACT